LGNYKLQVSGSSYFSGTVVFKGSTFSGLADPTFNSGAANKHYVDVISSNILSKSNSGYARVSSLSLIPHNLSNIPSFVNVSPSGMFVNFGISCKVDSENIRVYLTAMGLRDVFWTAKL